MIKTIAPIKREKDYKITVGADPELFLKDKDNNIIPAFFFVKGTKDIPEPISNDGHAIQYDNVMLEYNIPPCNTEDEFVSNNKFVLNYVRDTICKNNDLILSIEASAHLDEMYLANPISSEMGELLPTT